MKVSVIGASGGIGQPLSLLLKLFHNITELALVDTTNCRTPVKGVAVDLSHINTSVRVCSYAGDDQIVEALIHCDIVVMTAGCLTLKPGMTREALFDSSAGLVRKLALLCAEHCPLAFVAMVTNPVNSMVPIFAETKGIDPNRVFGVTTLDRVRACTFVANFVGQSPRDVSVPVIGGHGGESILALVSQSNYPVAPESCVALERRVVRGAFEVLDAKQSTATLSMAYAAAEFVKTLIKARKASVEDYAYVKNNSEYFAGCCRIGPNGFEEMKEIGTINEYEKIRLAEAKAKCIADVALARDFLKNVNA